MAKDHHNGSSADEEGTRRRRCTAGIPPFLASSGVCVRSARVGSRWASGCRVTASTSVDDGNRPGCTGVSRSDRKMERPIWVSDMNKKHLRDPVVLVFLGLVILLAPAAIGVMTLYGDAELRRAGLDLPGAPSLEDVSGVVMEFNPELTNPHLAVAYQARGELRSGLLVLYEASDQDRLV